MRLGRLVAVGALLAATPSLGIPAASSPEAVAVRAAAHPGFGRLVLDWPVPVAVDSWQRDQRLTLRFARPFAADLSPVMDALGDYLVGLERADSREIVLRLAPTTTARLEADDDRIVVVDLQRDAAPSGPVTVRTGVQTVSFGSFSTGQSRSMFWPRRKAVGCASGLGARPRSMRRPSASAAGRCSRPPAPARATAAASSGWC